MWHLFILRYTVDLSTNNCTYFTLTGQISLQLRFILFIIEMWLIYLFLLHPINKYSLIFLIVFSKWCTVNRRLYAAIIKEKRLFVNMWPRLFVLLPTLRCLQYYTVNTEQYLSSVRWWIRTQDLWLRSLICVTSKPPHLIILISHGATANHNFYWLALGAGSHLCPKI